MFRLALNPLRNVVELPSFVLIIKPGEALLRGNKGGIKIRVLIMIELSNGNIMYDVEKLVADHLLVPFLRFPMVIRLGETFAFDVRVGGVLGADNGQSHDLPRIRSSEMTHCQTVHTRGTPDVALLVVYIC